LGLKDEKKDKVGVALGRRGVFPDAKAVTEFKNQIRIETLKYPLDV
jgi:hypothetical protein